MGKMLITLPDEYGRKLEYEVVCTFESENNKHKYICYTDNKKTESGQTKLYISSYIEGKEKIKIFPIKDKKEWAWIVSKFSKKN